MIAHSPWRREILSGIFQPLVADINALVRAQVDSVRIKRMDENHTKGKEIKVVSSSSVNNSYLQ